MDAFTQSYLEAALWAGTDPDTGDSLDEGYGISDIAPEAIEELIADCQEFQTAHSDLFQSLEEVQRAGRDFYFTRNQHGVGFWSGYWPEPDATTLTNASHTEGTSEIYLGDDGLLYVSH